MTGGSDILLQTQQLDAAARFYEEHFGLRRFHSGPDLIGLDAGAFKLSLDRGPAFGPVLEFFVPDLEHARAALLRDGCRIEQEDPAIPRCYVRDPFGLIFNVAERKPAAA